MSMICTSTFPSTEKMMKGTSSTSPTTVGLLLPPVHLKTSLYRWARPPPLQWDCSCLLCSLKTPLYRWSRPPPLQWDCSSLLCSLKTSLYRWARPPSLESDYTSLLCRSIRHSTETKSSDDLITKRYISPFFYLLCLKVGIKNKILDRV